MTTSAPHSALCFIFPGQGSQKKGMLADMQDAYPIVKQTLSEAADHLKLDIISMMTTGEGLDQTENTQPILLASSIALWRLWQQHSAVTPQYVAGHSLGEYSALVATDSLSFGDALHLVKLRGKLMQQAVPKGSGAMAAILGGDVARIEHICAEISVKHNSVVAAANYNAPGQVVISGNKDAVEATCSELKIQLAVKALLLPVSVPSHCALMKPAAEELKTALAQIELKTPRFPIIQNVSAKPVYDPQQIRTQLFLQLFSAVYWQQSIEHLVLGGVTTFVECGSGTILTGLNKRIIDNPVIQNYSLGTITAFTQSLEKLSISTAS